MIKKTSTEFLVCAIYYPAPEIRACILCFYYLIETRSIYLSISIAWYELA